MEATLLTFGVLLILIGLIGKVKAKEIDVGTQNPFVRIILGVIGVLFVSIALRIPLPFNVPGLTVTPTTSNPPTVTEVSASPTSLVIPTDTPKPPPESRVIPFASPNDPGLLNSVYGWQQGNSPDNAYALIGNNEITLISDGNVDQWDENESAPLILFPIERDYEAQVKVEFSERSGGEFSGFGVRSIQDHKTWIRIVTIFNSDDGHMIALDVTKQGDSRKETSHSYYSDTVYLKMQRRGQNFDFEYSAVGSNWITLEENYSMAMPSEVDIFLVASSWSSDSTQAQFYDFTIK